MTETANAFSALRELHEEVASCPILRAHPDTVRVAWGRGRRLKDPGERS